MHQIAILDDDIQWGLATQQFLGKEFLVSIFTEPESLLAMVDQYQVIIVEFCLTSTLSSARQMDGYCLICRLKSTLSNPPHCLLVSGRMSYNDLKVIRDRPYCMADDVVAKDSGLEIILEKTKRLLQMPRPSLRSPR